MKTRRIRTGTSHGGRKVKKASPQVDPGEAFCRTRDMIRSKYEFPWLLCVGGVVLIVYRCSYDPMKALYSAIGLGVVLLAHYIYGQLQIAARR